MEENNHHTVLLNGSCQEILQEINQEMESIQTILEQTGLTVDMLSYNSQQSFLRMESFAKEAAKSESRFVVIERRIKDTERKPGVSDIFRLENELQTTEIPQRISKIKREIQQLRSLHANKLSLLAQHKQALLKERLELIKILKNVMLLEINILDDSKNLIKRKIIEQTRELGDPDGEKVVLQMLENLSLKETVALDIKLEPANVDVHNIYVLNEMLNEQMNNIRKIERAVAEKRRTVETLNEIISDIRQQVPDEKPAAAHSSVRKPEQTTLGRSIPNSSSSTSRMAIRNRFKK
jgi:hypothetical protein